MHNDIDIYKGDRNKTKRNRQNKTAHVTIKLNETYPFSVDANVQECVCGCKQPYFSRSC